MEQHQGYPRARARWPAVLLIMALVAGFPDHAVIAAEPNSVVGARHLADQYGGSPSDYQLVDQRTLLPVTRGAPTWSGKYVDLRTGAILSAYGGGAAGIGSRAVLDAALEQAELAKPMLDRKADRALVAAVAGGSQTKSLPVAVWIAVDTEGAEAAVREAHPEVVWLANRPVPSSLDQARALRGELWEARRSVIASAADTFRAEIERLGGSVAYVSTSAPLVFVDLPASAVAAVAERTQVLSLGLESEWRIPMSSAGVAVDANWTSGAGDRGNGVRVAVVEYENSATDGDLSGQVVRRYSTTGSTVTGIHPTWVAGAVASLNSSWAGTAPGADIVSASTGGYSPSLSTDRAIIAAADWAVSPSGGDADIVNASIGQDTSTGAEEARRYFDSLGWEHGRLVVAASGNYSTFGNWDVVSPGTGYNVMTVGGLDDRNSGGVGDDRLWYVPGLDGAAYRDRTDAGWNTHGDYNKPNLSAPAANVRTANGTYGSGTSIASPIVAGIAAQLLARQPILASWPEATRAILMAGAIRNTPMPGGGYSEDHEGVGSASALWSNRILDDGAIGGWEIGSMVAGQTIVHEVPVVKDQLVHVALAWSSHTTGGSITGKSDRLMADLDLVVRQPNGETRGSYTWDNSYESVGFTATSTGTLRVEVRHDRFDASQEPYAVAWALTSPFADTYTSRFYSDILWAYGQGITSGCAPDLYCPSDPVTRAEMATFLTRAFDLPWTSQDFFTDDEDLVHEGAINRLRKAGITTGCTATRFCPNRLVTRGQMATFLARALALPPAGDDYFNDDDGTAHEDSINRVFEAGITTGCSASRFCPDGIVSRAQMAAFLHRALGD
jgi:hypothetical protein